MFSIRPATIEDIPAIDAIEQLWDFRKLPADAMETTGAFNRLIGANKLADFIQRSDAAVLVACFGGNESQDLIGYLVAYDKALALQIHPDLSINYAPTDPVWHDSFAYVKSIAVHPDQLGKGVGKGLLQHFIDHARSGPDSFIVARISVIPNNQRSISLFSALLGSKEIGREFDPVSGMTWGVFKSCPLRQEGERRSLSS